MAQSLKCLPAMRETWVRSLAQEDPLEKEMATRTPIFLPGESYGRRSLAGYSPWARKELDTTERLHFHLKSYSGIKTSEIMPAKQEYEPSVVTLDFSEKTENLTVV